MTEKKLHIYMVKTNLYQLQRKQLLNCQNVGELIIEHYH